MGLYFVPFPGPSSSGDQVLGKHTLLRWVVCHITSSVPAAQFPGCTTRAPSQVCRVFFRGADLLLRPSWWMSTIQDPRKSWLATGSLITVWWRMPSLGPRLPPHLPALAITLLPLCIWRGDGSVCSQLALSWRVHSILCSVSGPGCALQPSSGKFSLSLFFPLSGYPTVCGAISH